MVPTLSRARVAGVLALGFLAAAPAAGDILYGIRGGNILFRLDTNTRIATTVGTVTGFGAIGGLAFAPDGALYGGVTTQGMTASGFLVTISRFSGAATAVGDTRASAIVGLGFDKATAVRTVVGRRGSWPSPASGASRSGRSGPSGPSTRRARSSSRRPAPPLRRARSA